MINIKKIFKILIPLLICIVVSSLFVYLKNIDYDIILKPKFAPNEIVFPIVWSIIYIILYYCMSKNINNNKAYILYLLILSLHTLWNLTFFLLGSFLVSLILLVIIYIVSWIYIYILSLNNKKYFYLNIIYLLWLMIALYLNIGIYLLN